MLRDVEHSKRLSLFFAQSTAGGARSSVTQNVAWGAAEDESLGTTLGTMAAALQGSLFLGPQIQVENIKRNCARSIARDVLGNVGEALLVPVLLALVLSAPVFLTLVLPAVVLFAQSVVCEVQNHTWPHDDDGGGRSVAVVCLLDHLSTLVSRKTLGRMGLSCKPLCRMPLQQTTSKKTAQTPVDFHLSHRAVETSRSKKQILADNNGGDVGHLCRQPCRPWWCCLPCWCWPSCHQRCCCQPCWRPATWKSDHQTACFEMMPAVSLKRLQD